MAVLIVWLGDGEMQHSTSQNLKAVAWTGIRTHADAGLRYETGRCKHAVSRAPARKFTAVGLGKECKVQGSTRHAAVLVVPPRRR